MIFSPTQYSTLKRRLRQRYLARYSRTLQQLKTLPALKSAHWCLEHQAELKSYDPLKWYFLRQLEQLIFFAQAQLPLHSSEDGFTPREDQVFERWNGSEFADVMMKALAGGKTLSQANQLALKQFDQHLVILGERHLLKRKKTTAAYRPQTSLGEGLLETTLHIEGKELRLFTASLKEMKKQSQRIEVALKVIRKHSPGSWERFCHFTDTIIPIRQKELVSYSHQDLPGTSMINLVDRDFVDLMDDLLHENGHHHLNYYLNLGTLIDEPIENIYFSPWRSTLRPLRGIYHAYFTFFWAFQLFFDLAQAREMDSIFYLFSDEEKEKIYWRVVEEFWMLDFTFEDLKRARRRGLIHDAGWVLIQEQRRLLLRAKPKIAAWERRLKTHRRELGDLKKNLKQAAQLYR
jgi:hypothetical protein